MPSTKEPKIPREYRLIRPLGRGAQGIVSLVQKRSSGEMAVHKTMREYEMADKRWPMEPYVMKTILPESPRLTRLRDSYRLETATRGRGSVANKELVLIYEYCAGGDLQRAVRGRDRIAEDFIWHVFVQVAEALDVMHNRGSEAVMHGDVKPDNVFLEREYRPGHALPGLKLGDFGTAPVGEYAEGIHVPVWQGPEMPCLSAAGDIWALGAIIHWLGHDEEALIRDPPAGFRGTRKEWVMRPQARKPIPLPRRYSAALNDYMLDCLEWDPRDRISSSELVHGLKRDRYSNHGKSRTRGSR